MRNLLISCALCLSACGTAQQIPLEPKIIHDRVEVRIPVPCDFNIGDDPTYPDTSEALSAAPDIYELVKLYKRGRLLRIARDAEKTLAIGKCRELKVQ